MSAKEEVLKAQHAPSFKSTKDDRAQINLCKSACMLISLFVVLGGLLLASPAHSDSAKVFQEQYATGCLTKESHEKLLDATTNKNRSLYFSLVGRVCFIVGGQEYSVIERGAKVSKVKVKIDGKPVELYISSSNIK